MEPLVGAGRVADLLAAGLPGIGATGSVEPAQINGCPALLVRIGGELSRVERETAVSR
ncbi:hypothetical protein P2Q00_21955 [Streptomyces coacervatus]|uniref:hypothetical protein n=1 Tax=Streptomyces coacervatus TaxID=647381 RepID=UPI0023DC5F50|nr:hypothetical protein [Streptomyces coacervatus]MDF2268080.1 hypothetical protein [Streptomyces coacervatus]